jgi:prepilin signal peptidase PulO-like enzyme (type II secretory pathway)
MLFVISPLTEGIIISTLLSIVIVFDIKRKIIPFYLNIVILIISFILGVNYHGYRTTILGGLGGFISMLLLYYFGLLFAKYFQKLHSDQITVNGLGLGDVLFGGGLSLLIGWPFAIILIFLAIIFAGSYSLIYIAIKKATNRYRTFTSIPLTPFFVLSAILLF